MKDKDITEQIIGCAFKIHRALGSGFLEKIYENALVIELGKMGLHTEQQKPIPVYYEGEKLGEYYADLFVENCVICEIKASSALSKENEAQLVNYLVATGVDTGLLINFGNSVIVRRKFREYKKSINPVHPEESC